MDDTDVADAIRYVFRIAKARGAAAVVNLSLGDHDDGHDGSDALSRVIDQASGPGRIVCCAAGNEGDDNIHGVARVTRAGDAGMRFHVPGRSVGEASLTGWYPPGSALEVAGDAQGEAHSVSAHHRRRRQRRAEISTGGYRHHRHHAWARPCERRPQLPRDVAKRLPRSQGSRRSVATVPPMCRARQRRESLDAR